MKITFLGTGSSQGIPVIACKCKTCKSDDEKDKRLRSSILVQLHDKNFVIDAGPDFRYQLLRSAVTKIDGIFITHGHKDHVGGLDDIRALNYYQNTAINVYANKSAIPDLKREFHYAFEDNKYPGTPAINLIQIANLPFIVSDIKIQSIKVQHQNKPVFGFRINKFTYITDANYISNSELKKIAGSDVIVINALKHEKHTSHFNLEEAIQILNKLKPRKAYLTHISHLMGLHKEISKNLPDFIELAYDNLQLDLR